MRAVIVESYERIHRSNLVGMGVLPLQFKDGDTRETLGLTGDDSFTIKGLADLKPAQDVEVEVTRADGTTFTFTAHVPHRYRQRDGILPQRRHPAVRAAQAGSRLMRRCRSCD